MEIEEMYHWQWDHSCDWLMGERDWKNWIMDKENCHGFQEKQKFYKYIKNSKKYLVHG